MGRYVYNQSSGKWILNMHKNTKKVLGIIILLTLSILFLLQLNYSIRTGTVVSIELISTSIDDNLFSFYFGVLVQLLIGLSLIKGVITVVKDNFSQ
jgi:hypothetical protein